MSLPYPGMDFTPFDILTASELDQMVENIESLADGTGLDAAAVTPSKRSGGFKVGSIAGSTFSTTGSKPITGLGFKPKFIRFRGFGADNAGAAGSAEGACDESLNQYLTMVYITDTPNAGRRSSNARCIGYMGTTSGYAMAASLTSMDADGFTLDCTLAGTGFTWYYEAHA